MPPENADSGVHLDAQRDRETVLATLAEVAELWGGEWRREGNGGALELPVQAGLRHGLLDLRVETTALGVAGTRLELRVERERWVLHRAAVGMLVIAGLGSLAGVLWPFFPALGTVLPLALVLGVGAWLGVLSRLRNRGVRELLAEVEERLAADEVESAVADTTPEAS